MKKSEKIEVRVSHDEKERLSGIAETRGLSVSELIRDAVAEDIGTVPHVPRWPGYAAIAAGTLALAALVAALIPPSTTPQTGATGPTVMSVSFNENDAFGINHATVLEFQSGVSETIELSFLEGPDIRIVTRLKAKSEAIMGTTFTVCTLNNTQCDETQTLELAVERFPGRYVSAGGDVRFGDKTLDIGIGVRPLPQAETTTQPKS